MPGEVSGAVATTAFNSPSNEDVARLGTGPIPAAPYYRPEYFELEREAIFRRTWIQVGHVCELPEPGSFIVRPIEAVNASILITRGKDGQLRAFHNVCTHRGTQLVSQSSGRQSAFTCPYHAWTFTNEGRLRSAPDFERFYIDKSQCDLPQVSVDVCAGLIFIHLERSAPQGLREFLGALAPQLESLPVARATTFSEWVYEVDANWKLVWDNFQENYHLRFIHPRSAAPACGPQNPFGYAVNMAFHGVHRTQRIWSNPQVDITPVQRFGFGRLYEFAAADGLIPSEHHRDYYSLFPNFNIIGTPTNHFSHVVMPLSAGRTRGVFRMYWIGEDENATERFARELAAVSAIDVHAEDRSVLEAGQRGLSGGALQYIHFQSQEALCRHFFNAVDEAVQTFKEGVRVRGAVA
jgi:phenylpropionate dioxygenase-like ring-hydroxylating dioxygenase large terminal subunit